MMLAYMMQFLSHVKTRTIDPTVHCNTQRQVYVDIHVYIVTL